MRLRWGNKKSTRKYAWNTRKRKIEPVWSCTCVRT
jgi:hypothetical protein